MSERDRERTEEREDTEPRKPRRRQDDGPSGPLEEGSEDDHEDDDELLGRLDAIEAFFGDDEPGGDGVTESVEVTDEFRQWVDALPNDTPAEIVERLRALGYHDQTVATRAMALAAHRHVRRIKALYVDELPRTSLPPKQNLLLVGPTGCGKTFLATLLFREILQIPTATVDITSYSESGYIGEDVNSLVTRLLYAAEGDLLKTKVGMILMDEFDKLASSQNRAVFAGQGTTKDVSGFGVQRELLKMLEAATVTVPTAFSHDTYQSRPLLSTEDISFVACGAFSGLKSITERTSGPSLGFRSEQQAASIGEISVSYDQRELDNVKHFQEYGFLPELVARFTRIIPFQPLDRVTLRSILGSNVIEDARRELALAGIELEVDESVVDRVVDDAIERQIGARGLRNSLLYYLEDAAFEAYSDPDTKAVVLTVESDAIVARSRK